ncbi:hypothetical protein M8818_000685 [Zalaria obscura]|uniref:Uncharacterized protein n=1 Tax=Zalaria obscura TaxID=2024903 RepID=A0ACC3SLX9_9PEZI
MSEHSTPALPNELWVNILSFIDDLPYLWLSCRQVSKTFRSSVDLVFALHHLKRTVVFYPLEPIIDSSVELDFSPRLAFKSFSADNRLAYFTNALLYTEEDLPLLRRSDLGEQWRKKMRLYDTSSIELPHTVCITGLFYEPPFKDFGYNLGQEQIWFDWRAMVQNFFLEHRRAEWHNHHMQSDEYRTSRLKRANRKTVAHTEAIVGRIWVSFIPPVFSKAAIYGRIMARRERLRRYSRALRRRDYTLTKKFWDGEGDVLADLLEVQISHGEHLTSGAGEDGQERREVLQGSCEQGSAGEAERIGQGRRRSTVYTLALFGDPVS